jgi:hypothetical protein
MAEVRAAKTSGELIQFINKRVNVRLEDGRSGCGVLRVWQMQGPREYPFALEPSGREEIGALNNRRFYAREVTEIEVAT